MRENNKKLIVLIILIVFIGLSIMTLIEYSNYSNIIKEDILNITRLISTNIYADIQLELIKPIYVALTMANDQFMKDWIELDKEADKDVIKQYLKGIRDKYDYDSTFLISEITKNYYHHEKLLKQVNDENLHDIWYYDLIEKNVEYSLDVDTDQASSDDLTVFVNCLIRNSEDELLGVTGVGVKMLRIANILNKYNQELGVNTYLISADGIIQIHTDEDIIEKHNIFENPVINQLKNQILSQKSEIRVFEIESKGYEEYLISYYIEELDWYLIVEKDTLLLKETLNKQMIRELMLFLGAFFLLSLIFVNIINYYQKLNFEMATKDSLTDIGNRLNFDQKLNMSIQNAQIQKQPFTVVLMDIDDFKDINDTYGHLVGDEVLIAIAAYLKQFLRKEDTISRWGGDEFSAIFNCNAEETLKIIQRMVDEKNDSLLLKKYNVTISIGIAEYKAGDTGESIIIRVDKALYQAKNNGKNRINISRS